MREMIKLPGQHPVQPGWVPLGDAHRGLVSEGGFKTAGHWFTIPDSKTWHTATFRLEDPQFVNYWGYNFSLESDGNTYNRYYLKSVEVRKVQGAAKPR